MLVRTPALTSQGTAADPPRLVRMTIGAFWLIYFVVNTLRMSFWAPAAEQLDMLPRRALVCVAGVALTFAFHRLIRPLDRSQLWQRVYAIALGAALFATIYAFVNGYVFYRLYPTQFMLAELASESHHLATWKLVLDSAIGWYFFFAAWGALYLAVGYAQRAHAAERTALEATAQARDAQLRALRYQINPHFLFNALNSLSALVLRARPEEAERMILNLSTFFRTSLATDPIEDVPLSEEIRLQRLYLDIEAVRFPERLRVEIDVPPELEADCVPTLILQPLVENAIKHGVAASTEPVNLIIRARANGTGLTLLVENDGPMVCQSTPRASAVGLANVRARLLARFGTEAECSFGPRATGGWRSAIRVPVTHRDC